MIIKKLWYELSNLKLFHKKCSIFSYQNICVNYIYLPSLKSFVITNLPSLKFLAWIHDLSKCLANWSRANWSFFQNSEKTWFGGFLRKLLVPTTFALNSRIWRINLHQSARIPSTQSWHQTISKRDCKIYAK